MSDSVSLTVLISMDWEIVYVNGEKAFDGHSVWPYDVLNHLEGKRIEETKIISDEDILEYAEKEVVTDPKDPEEIWSYPDKLPDEL